VIISKREMNTNRNLCGKAPSVSISLIRLKED
jgi:hypothetical protein